MRSFKKELETIDNFKGEIIEIGGKQYFVCEDPETAELSYDTGCEFMEKNLGCGNCSIKDYGLNCKRCHLKVTARKYVEKGVF